jgi:hypothetical protein
MADFILQSFLTEASTVARGDMARTVPGMAHFAGTGPSGATCAHCVHWQNSVHGRKHICRKHEDLMGRSSTKPVPGTTPSCRYFGRGQP